MQSMLMLISRCNQPVFHRNAFSDTPQGRDFDAVDAIAPRVPLHVNRLVVAVGELQTVKLTARELAHRGERWLDIAQYFGGKRPCKQSAPFPVSRVLISQLRRRPDQRQSKLEQD